MTFQGILNLPEEAQPQETIHFPETGLTLVILRLDDQIWAARVYRKNTPVSRWLVGSEKYMKEIDQICRLGGVLPQ